MTAQARSLIVDYLRRELIGPAGGEDEEIGDPPQRRYTSGLLFPRDAPQEAILNEDTDDATVGAFGDDPVDDPVALANQWMPSSVGISFFVQGAEGVTCRLSAARYEPVEGSRGQRWKRAIIVTEQQPDVVDLRWSSESQRSEASVLEGRGRIQVFARPVASGRLVTVSLLNDQVQDRDGPIDPAKCLLQVRLTCEPIGGSILEYPRAEVLSSDPEEDELQLLHRQSHVFAIGHGCAAMWDGGETVAHRVSVEFMPAHEVPALEPVKADSAILRLAHLSDVAVEAEHLGVELRSFIDAYEAWAAGLPGVNADIPTSLHPARDRLLGRIASAARRMRAGVDLLENDPVVLRAFRLSNLSMLMQMHHTKVVAAASKPRDTGIVPDFEYGELVQYRWYPFQLAFLLLTLPSVASEADPDRQTVDLIWFPTGGGKTEAYLGVAAFEIFLRRLRHGDRGAGTAVITRYTLRLLTAQQFQRMAALACCCEVLRIRNRAEMGSLPITIGLWVGGGASPNKFLEARDRLQQLQDDSTSESFLQVDRCPWCGTVLIPEDRDDLAGYGVDATATSFRMFCPSADCPFHESLPISVVDEAMYVEAPTMVVGTVDKFAQLAWSDKGGAFFGLGRFAPPSLIIQDELHLISGPLGTTVGIYEAAIEGLLSLAGAKPKILASTATIRRSEDQVRGVFGRPVSLFPPAGLTASDSYFARENHDRPGRLYVGVMSQSHTPSTSLIHLSAALAEAPIELALTGDSLDAYWTQVVYHNSLRELGKTVTYARDDIPARVAVIAADEARRRDLSDDVVVELTGNVPSSSIPAILGRLFIPQGMPEAISILLATNMIQVGIDVPRLGLMVVNGQPKTTSEYIQASSRIGRAEAVGLVVTLYSASKPRDRSHYESFLPYHQALYRHVEPTSVTPFALPSRKRALHAAFVILVRHGIGLGANGDAVRFDPAGEGVVRMKRHLLDWVAIVDRPELEATEAHLDRLIQHWAMVAEQQRRDGSPMFYQAGRQHRRLLKRFYETGEGWETLDSMRSVDRESSVDVIGGSVGA